MAESRHILRVFDAALESLRADVLMMASLTDRNLQNAMTCLLDRDAAMCAITIADESEIDLLEKKVDRMASKFCAVFSRSLPISARLSRT